LTPDRPTPAVENDKYAAFVRRVVRAYSRRVATGDVEALTELVALSREIDHVINLLAYIGAGWKTTGDALLANTAAALARERQQVAREELAALPLT
jgi:hypothetical protein